MYKKFVLLTFAISMFLVFSCQRKESAPSSEEEVSFEHMIIEDMSTIKNPGFALVANTGLYVITGEDTEDRATRTRWAASMALGESVLTGNTREMTFDPQNRIYNFIEVRRENGVEGWALASQIAVGGRLAVVVEERANLFRTPRSVDVTSTVFSRRSVVVYYPDTENNGFVQIRGFDTTRNVYVDPNSNIVRLNALSNSNSDVQSAILLQTAVTLTTEDQRLRREALLDSALLDYPDSVFNAEIYAIAHPEAPEAVKTADNKPADEH